MHYVYSWVNPCVSRWNGFHRKSRRKSLDGISCCASAPDPVYIASGYSRAKVLTEAVSEALSNALSPRQFEIITKSEKSHLLLLIFISSAYNTKDLNALPLYMQRALAFRSVPLSKVQVVGTTTAPFDISLQNDTESSQVEASAAHSIQIMSVSAYESKKEEDESVIKLPFQVFHVDEMNVDLEWRQEQWRRHVGVGKGAGVEYNLPMLLFHNASYERTKDVLDALDFAFPRATKVGAACAEVTLADVSNWDDNGQFSSVNPVSSRSLKAQQEFGVRKERKPSKEIETKRDQFSMANSESGLMFWNGRKMRSGVLGVAFDGNLRMDVAVAQGSERMGPILEVLEVEGDVIKLVQEVNSLTQVTTTPLLLLDMWKVTKVITKSEMKRAEDYLLVGILIEPAVENDDEEHWLVRKVTGLDTERGFVSIEGGVRVGQMISFQIRKNPENAMEELSIALKKCALKSALEADQSQVWRPIAASLFTDSERGKFLYGPKGHSVELVALKKYLEENSNGSESAVTDNIVSTSSSGQIAPLPAPGFSAYLPISTDPLLLGGRSFALSASSVVLLFCTLQNRGKTE
eukprot:CAMPEP_0182442762 /NCGR_PEP_ID=MMETSP1172-20130603/1646_1 /TAXON_ID=708627 /ORGANISM="Timspurckia oligopyrenoides, Strain CCMP3278" /LENGTH=576 /DNA_ID=CAMNT_0024637785 /DNA_START=29 /DNA_END=1759 /DNA_ORIENTATION=-